MKYFSAIDDGYDEIEVREDGGDLLVTFHGKTRRVNIRSLGQRYYSVILDGRSLAISAATIKGRVRVEADHQIHELSILNEREKIEAEMYGSADDSTPSGEVRAPMPGMILRIEVSAGDAVKAGQPLLVMEAMKMENEIRATSDAVVAEIAVSAQAAVEKDDLLIRLK